jgi:hypothetical protein
MESAGLEPHSSGAAAGERGGHVEGKVRGAGVLF